MSETQNEYETDAAPDYHGASIKSRDTQDGTCQNAPDLLRLVGGRVEGDLAEACYNLAADLENAFTSAEGSDQ